MQIKSFLYKNVDMIIEYNDIIKLILELIDVKKKLSNISCFLYK